MFIMPARKRIFRERLSNKIFNDLRILKYMSQSKYVHSLTTHLLCPDVYAPILVIKNIVLGNKLRHYLSIIRNIYESRQVTIIIIV